jgi:hypothetical protein
LIYLSNIVKKINLLGLGKYYLLKHNDDKKHLL